MPKFTNKREEAIFHIMDFYANLPGEVSDGENAFMAMAYTLVTGHEGPGLMEFHHSLPEGTVHNKKETQPQ